jgi:hypothetical protein
MRIFGPPTQPELCSHSGKAAPMTAAAEKEQTMQTVIPELTVNELKQALGDASVRQFQKRGPSGEIITDAPWIVDVLPESREVVFKDENGFWRAPYLVNGDRTCSIGLGVRVKMDWTPLTAAQTQALEQAVRELYSLQKGSGAAPPRIVEVRAGAAPVSSPQGTVIVAFKGEYSEVPYVFDGPRCWASTGRPIQKFGSHFGRLPAPTAGLELDVVTTMLRDELAKRGHTVSYGDCLAAAAKSMSLIEGGRKPEAGEFLTSLFRGFEKERAGKGGKP